MNPINLLIAAAVAPMGYAIWVRRHTLSSATERPLTLSVALCIAGFALVSPQAVPVIGAALHSATGVWHIDTYAGDLCLIASQISAQYALLGSLFTDEDRKAWMRFWVQPVVSVAIPHLTACVVLTRALRDGAPNILDSTPDAWLTGYWLILCTTTAYLWLAGLRVLRVMRRDCQSRHIANAYITAIGCGIVACALQISWVLTGRQPLGHGVITWCLLCSAYSGICLIAAWSWRLKEQRLRGNRPRLPV